MASVGVSLLGVILLMNQTFPLFVGGGPSDDVLVYLHAFTSHVCIYCFTHYTLNTPSHSHPHTLTLTLLQQLLPLVSPGNRQACSTSVAPCTS